VTVRLLLRRAGPLVAAGLLATASAAQAAPAEPEVVLKAAVDRVLKVVEDPALKPESRRAERRKAIRRIADEIFDFEEMAQRAMGPHWGPLTPEQRREFVPVFADVLERVYMTTIERYNGEPIQYLGQRVEGDLAVVATKVTTKQNQDVPVDYRMLRRGDRWMIYDVSIEGISLIGNYRTQFNSVLRTSTYPELVKRLRAKAEEPEPPR